MNRPEQIPPEIKDRLSDLKPVPPRDLQAAARGRARFLAEAASMRPGRQMSPAARLPIARRIALRTAVAALIVLALLFGGGVGAAYAAQDALPGETLYTVKIWTEDVRLGLVSSPESEISLLLQLTQTRLTEMNTLASHGLAAPAGVRQRLEMHIQAALELAAGLDDAGMHANLLHMHAELEAEEQTLAPGAGEQTRLMLRAQIALVGEGLVNPEGFRRAVRNRGRPEPTATPEPSAPATQPTGEHTRTGSPTPDQTLPTASPCNPNGTTGPDQGNGPQPTPGGHGGRP